MTQETQNHPNCAACRLRAFAERKPRSLLAALWRWHTRWCPGWKAYQRSLGEEAPHSQKSEGTH